MEGYCRCCLTKHEDHTQLLQYTEKNRHLYTYSTGLQVKHNDPLFLMCKHCLIKMKLACKFKKQCRTSDKKLTHFFTLREAGESINFDVFLKNCNDSFSLKFPHNGSSTPSHQKSKEDDNESTCTSIQNFMTDILKAEDLPDTEAQIIQEMIAKEADVLDDSLDSHWLQDDASFATDFRFSPFSTPRSKRESPNYSPINKEDDVDENNQQIFDEESYIAAKKILLKTPSPVENHQIVGARKILDPILSIDSEIAFSVKSKDVEEKEAEDTFENVIDDENNVLSGKEYYLKNKEMDTDIIDKDISKTEHEEPNNLLVGKNFYIETNVVNDSNIIVSEERVKDRIDKNLEEALKDENNKEFPLDSLIAIATPSVKSGVSGVATPLIADILFGDKVDGIPPKKHVYCTDDKSDNADADVLEDFFNKETGEYIGETKTEEKEIFCNFKVPEPKTDMPGVAKYDLSDFSCKICVRNFKNVKSLKTHFTKAHKFKIETTRRTEERLETTCDRCGKVFNFKSNLRLHMRNVHNKSKGVRKCGKCSLEFSSESKLKMHMVTHLGTHKRKIREPNAICNICGHQSTSLSNLKVHIARHNKEYAFKCDECGRPYYRKTDLAIHMRVHTGEKPYSCKLCDATFRRADVLNVHMKRHTDERPFKCIHCDLSFHSGGALNFHKRNSTQCVKLRVERAIEEEKPPKFEVKEQLIIGKVHSSEEMDVDVNVKDTDKEEVEIELLDFKDAENLYDELSEALKGAE